GAETAKRRAWESRSESRKMRSKVALQIGSSHERCLDESSPSGGEVAPCWCHRDKALATLGSGMEAQETDSRLIMSCDAAVELARNALGARAITLRTPRPPYRTGSETCNSGTPSRFTLRGSDRRSLMIESSF